MLVDVIKKLMYGDVVEKSMMVVSGASGFVGLVNLVVFIAVALSASLKCSVCSVFVLNMSGVL